QPEAQRVDQKDEESERQEREGQGQQDQGRLDRGVDDAEHKAGEDRCRRTRHGNARNDSRRQEHGDGVQDDAEQEAHAPRIEQKETAVFLKPASMSLEPQALSGQYMPPMPPGPPGDAASFFSSGISDTRASVVRSSDAMDEAFWSAVRTTFTGSMTPAATR